MRQRIFLAALLHDIGKFYQRADKPLNSKNELSTSVRNMVDYVCPQYVNGNYKYQHSIWTLQFLTEIENKLKQIPGFEGIDFSEENKRNSIFALSASHHKPSTKLQAIVTLADWWSAGSDRRENDEQENMTTNYGNTYNRFRETPLHSIFNEINKEKKTNTNVAFGLKPLSINENDFFPNIVANNEGRLSQDEYNNLWRQFKEEINKLPISTFEIFKENLVYLLKKYTWSIPSSTIDMATVSLFDHLKTTAAFADCLYEYTEENKDSFTYEGKHIKINEGHYPVLLVGGDLSGIQKFIYNIASRKASNSLKGRSFYLQLLIDTIILKIIQHKDIKASNAHVVYSSGGKFYMLLPNTEKVKKAIREIKFIVDEELFEEHQGQLIFNLNYVPFNYNTSRKEKPFESSLREKENLEIGQLWQLLAEKLTEQKTRPYNKYITEYFDELFTVQTVNNKDGVCAVTGIEGKCIVLDSKVEKDKRVYVLPSVKKQEELGKALKNTDYIATCLTENDVNAYLEGKTEFQIEIAGYTHYFLKKNSDITSIDNCKILNINNTNLINQSGKDCIYGFQYYGGNKQAQNSFDRNKTFAELADGEYLGILRMDVDNLGGIFINGLSEANKSFSANATLSFMLDYFFSGYLNTIREKYKDDVNILYSGGDDVFAIGKWNKLIEFAKTIRTDFERFVGRPDITISGGIAIVGEKFPLSKGAELAGEAEHAAKEGNNGEKNAFNIFDETIAWGKEFNFVEEQKNDMLRLYENKSITKGFLHNLQRYSLLAKNNNLTYLWHTTYYLTRFMKDRIEKKETVNYCTELRDKTLKNKKDFILMGIAARWAELELREWNK